MLSAKFAVARVSVIACVCSALGWGAAPREPGVAAPTAVATNAEVDYCFARLRGLDPTRLPQAYLVLQLRVRVSYRNTGTRPLILPLARERKVYTGFKPAAMSLFHEPVALLDPTVKPMKDLPPDVSPDSPVSPTNDVFTVIPAGGEMTPPLLEDIALPVDRQALFRKYPNLKGHRVYIKLEFVHQELTAALAAHLSDQWARFGVPWTGPLTTNTFIVDVPAAPQAVACADSYEGAPITTH